MEALEEVRGLQEDNIDLMRKAAGGSAQNIKMKDGKLKMDKFTASAIMQVYDKVNPANQKKMTVMINKGTKDGMLKLQSFAMKQLKSSYEETELDEDKKKELVKLGKEVEGLARRSSKPYGEGDENDKKDMLKVAAMLKKGDRRGVEKFAKTLDDHRRLKTFGKSLSPQDYVLDLLDYVDQLDEQLDEALPSHLKKFFDKDGNPKSKEGKAAWERIAKAKGFKKYTDKQIKMAIGVAFDKRYVQGNMTGAAKTIEKIAKGLSNIEPVRDALRRANEEVVKEGTWHIAKDMKGLKKILSKPLKAKDAVETIAPFIGDDELYDEIGDMKPNDDARNVIKKAMKRLRIREETILDRIDAKLKERKNG